MKLLTRIVIACVFGFVLASSLRADEPRAPVRLRVLSYNIHHGEGTDGKLDLERIAKIISGAAPGAAPDLVSLQEVDQKLPRSGGVDQPAELARLTGMHAIFGSNYQFDGGDYGNAVLSRWPIRRQQNHRLPSPTPGEPRGVLEAEVELEGGEPLVLLATHLDHRPIALNRRESAAAINKLALAAPERLSILAGDLNAIPESDVLKVFFEAWQASGAKAVLTSPAQNPRRQIDYVLVRPASRWRTVDLQVLDEPIASDHRPLLATLELLP